MLFIIFILVTFWSSVGFFMGLGVFVGGNPKEVTCVDIGLLIACAIFGLLTVALFVWMACNPDKEVFGI